MHAKVWRVRLATPEDIIALQAIELASFNQADGRLSARAMKYHINKQRLWVAVRPQVLAYALWLPRKQGYRLYSLASSEPGGGSALIAHFLGRTQQPCWLEVRASNKKAIALYKHYGFDVVDELPNYYGDGELALKLRRVVHPPAPETHDPLL
ncbi:GNAT family protein [Salinibius halmophilus]|uniref:hypothetical protein n=1 Tax=Salinibius halmophilus TaxID=1853216 RepID=UPI000E662FDC|nr:hypothetical protein [Salinibius halmophilus]